MLRYLALFHPNTPHLVDGLSFVFWNTFAPFFLAMATSVLGLLTITVETIIKLLRLYETILLVLSMTFEFVNF